MLVSYIFIKQFLLQWVVQIMTRNDYKLNVIRFFLSAAANPLNVLGTMKKYFLVTVYSYLKGSQRTYKLSTSTTILESLKIKFPMLQNHQGVQIYQEY